MGNVLKDELSFPRLLIWMNTALQILGILFLISGAAVFINAMVTHNDRLNWIVILFSASIFSANLGLGCMVLGCRRLSAKEQPQERQKPVSCKPDFIV